ncbi:MAG: hypothetical protein EOP38_17145 [Rubrivivax sp.]|nr:MAG: hypothetical protein EOP38_17145 [Rubrivivax sp.]
MSREHVVSKTVFDVDSCGAAAAGLKRIPDGVAAEQATAKILCKRHNELLSAADAEAGKLARFLTAPRPEKIELSGNLIEQWVLKTILNFMAAGWVDHMRHRPDEELVQAAYGRLQLKTPLGLYSMDGRTGMFHSPNSIASRCLSSRVEVRVLWNELSWVPLLKFGAAGAVLSLHGLQFLYAFDSQLPGELTGLICPTHRVWEGNDLRLVHRPAYIGATTADGDVRQILLNFL